MIASPRTVDVGTFGRADDFRELRLADPAAQVELAAPGGVLPLAGLDRDTGLA
ncbi:MAG: hypothetical protein U1E62_24480 [Alsobacter sp.]